MNDQSIMTYQIKQKVPKKAHIEQEVPENTHIEQETFEEVWIKQITPTKVQVPEKLWELSKLCTHGRKNGIKIILLLTIFLLSKWLLIS